MQIYIAKEDTKKKKNILTGLSKNVKTSILIFMYFSGENNKWHLLNIYYVQAVTYLNIPNL